MIYSVGMQQRWLPSEFDSMFLDDRDHFGLEYWYNNVKRYSDQVRDASKGKKKE